jgi:hypothetical protein
MPSIHGNARSLPRAAEKAEVETTALGSTIQRWGWK